MNGVDRELDVLFARIKGTYYRARLRIKQGRDIRGYRRSVASKLALCIDLLGIVRERQALIAKALVLDPEDDSFIEMAEHARIDEQTVLDEIALYDVLNRVMNHERTATR